MVQLVLLGHAEHRHKLPPLAVPFDDLSKFVDLIRCDSRKDGMRMKLPKPLDKQLRLRPPEILIYLEHVVSVEVYFGIGYLSLRVEHSPHHLSVQLVVADPVHALCNLNLLVDSVHKVEFVCLLFDLLLLLLLPE